VDRSANYATVIVVARLLVNIVHGLAHSELHVGFRCLDLRHRGGGAGLSFDRSGAPLDSQETIRTYSPSLSMFGSLLFGLSHHFLVVSRNPIHSQFSSGWGTRFVRTAYLLLITEAIGTYAGIHFWIAEKSSSRAIKA
jgi:hypothetical protein